MSVVKAFRLLIVEDDVQDAELLVGELVRSGFSPQWTRVDSRQRIVAALRPLPALVLCDYSLPGLDALDVLEILREQGADVPLIVVSGQMDEETCVKSLRMGAVDYLLKDRLVRLGPAVEHALATRRLTIEKRRIERQEVRTSSILAGLVAHAPAAISVKGVDGRYLLANRQFELLAGTPSGQLVGRIDADVFSSERAREMTDLDARCLQHRIVLEREEEFVTGAGTTNLICVRYPVIDESGEIFGIGAIYLDITRQKRIENQLRLARAEVASRAEELDANNEQLRRADRFRTDLIASVSHELRTPLSSIRGYVEMLQDGGAGAGGVALSQELSRRFLSIIDRNSEHLLSLIEDLLVLSKIDSGALEQPFQKVSLAQIVGDAAAMLEPAARQAELSLRLALQDDLPLLSGHRDQLERVVINLLSNAVKFSTPGGTVEVEAAREPGGQLRLSVRDHGIGIAAPDQHKLFARFYRTAAAREQGIAGTGLGLAVVKGIVEGHGGAIEVNSAPGRGTTMTVRLPVAD